MNVPFDLYVFFGLLTASFLICWAVVLLYPSLIQHVRERDDLKSVQAAHERATPRFGGIAIMIPCLIALIFLIPDEKAPFFALFAITLTPVFIAGFAEDLGLRVSANGRLFAAASSAGLSIVLLQIWIPPFGLPGIDLLLGFTPFAIMLTLLWATGICHAINLIDGVNGLAGSAGLLIATAIAVVAEGAGAHGFATVAFALVPALIGFLLFNWPLGRLFMGDAGAYTLGHVLVWLAIGLAWHNKDASALALSLMFFWPVADTILAIVRRRRAGRPINAPDRLHYHQLVMRGLMLVSGGRIGKGVANSATTLVLLPLVAAPIFTAVHLWDRPLAALIAWIVYGLLFATSYVAGVRFFRGSGWRKVARRINPRTFEHDSTRQNVSTPKSQDGGQPHAAFRAREARVSKSPRASQTS